MSIYILSGKSSAGNEDQRGPLSQAQAESDLQEYLEANCVANMKQSLNDVVDGKGKATGDYTFGGHAVLHASSGNGQKSVSLFYYQHQDDQYIIAMGEHDSSSSYKLVYYGQTAGDFKYKAKINL